MSSREYNLYSNYAQNIQPEPVPDGFTRVYREDTVLGEIVPNEIQRFINEGGYSLTPVLNKNELKYINSSETLELIKNSKIISVDDVEKCKELISQGYLPYNKLPGRTNKIPYVNLIFGVISIYSFVRLSRK